MAWGSVELEPEVRDWLEELPSTDFARAAFYIDLLASRGVLLGEPHTRQLDGKLRELRFYLEHSAGTRDVLDSFRAEDHPVDGVPQDADAGGPGDPAGSPGA
ncbi:type II toxin-antitoxin system RelE/ParE family toxin [Micromonospora humida]|uniref:type II toxin-antitoxin system RelE/ParE family toxin n=1 Tax=Micromonospora humida TaxID=2809018 RepID=UPI0033D11F79